MKWNNACMILIFDYERERVQITGVITRNAIIPAYVTCRVIYHQVHRFRSFCVLAKKTFALDKHIEKKKKKQKNKTRNARNRHLLMLIAANDILVDGGKRRKGKLTYHQVLIVLIVRAILDGVIPILLDISDVKYIRVIWKHR